MGNGVCGHFAGCVAAAHCLGTSGKQRRGGPAVFVSMLPAGQGYQHIRNPASRAILFVLLNTGDPESKRNCKGKHSRETSTEQQLSESSGGVEMTLKDDHTGRAASLGDGPRDRAVSLDSYSAGSRTDSGSEESVI